MNQHEALRIERRYGKLIDTVLAEPDFLEERRGRLTILVPYYRIKFKGERRFVFVRGEVA